MTYLGCPYSNDPEFNYGCCSRYSAKMFVRGVMVFSPILHWHPTSRVHKLPGDAAYWWSYNVQMLDLIRHMTVLCLPEWEESKGLAQEMTYCKSMEYPMSYVESGNLDGICR